MKRPILAVNYYFGPEDLENRIFCADSKSMLSPYLRAFRDFMSARGVDVVTLDMVDFTDPNVKAVLYFEYNWRMLSKERDPFLSRIPYSKRALVLLEPAIINPTLYYTNVLRRRFKTVFTWDLRLLKKYPEYVPIRVPTGADPLQYRENRFVDIPFEKKKLLVSVSRNRWHYMPQSTFGLRRMVYRFMQVHAVNEFDLYGLEWDRPCCLKEKFLGRRYERCWRGEIPGSWDAKVAEIAKYRFSLCFENSIGQPGYLSEKIFDCFCARSVPVYYGSKGNEHFLPKGTFVDWRDFRSPKRLLAFLRNMDEVTHARYVASIDDFMISQRIEKFRVQTMYQTIFDRLFGGIVV